MKHLIKILGLLICFSLGNFAQSQDIRGKRVIVDQSLFLKHWIDSIMNDTTNLGPKTLLTAKAISELLNGRLQNTGSSSSGISKVVAGLGLEEVDDSTLAVSFKDSVGVKNYQNKKIWVWWGDSMTELPAGASSTTATQTLLGIQAFNKGISGNTSTEIRTRFEAEPGMWKYGTIIWSGANNFANKATVVQDIQAMVSALGHNNYVVIGITKTSAQTVGTAGSDQVDALNDTLRQVFGVHFKDANDYFVNVVPALSSQDNTDRTNEVPLSSYRSDNQHLNRLGTIYMAYFIRDSCLSQLTPASIDGAVIGDDIFEAYNKRTSISNIGTLRAVNESTESGLDVTVVGGYAFRGAEMVTNNLMLTDLTGWTATNWTAAVPGATHTTGNTSALSQSIPGFLISTLYQVEFTVSSSAGTIDCDLGSVKVYDPIAVTNGTIKRLIVAPSTGSLTLSFTPTSAFNGTITNVSVRRVRNEREANWNIRDTANNILLQVRAYPNDSWSIGKYSFIFNQSSTASIAIGDYNMREGGNHIGQTSIGWGGNQRGNNNSYGTNLGYQTIQDARETQYYTVGGANNTKVATFADFHTSWGARGFEKMTSARGNAGLGYLVAGNELDGEFGSYLGWQAYLHGRGGDNNIGIGRDAVYLPDFATNGYYTGSNGTFIGGRSIPWSRTQSNQMALGVYQRRLIGYDGLQHFKFNGLNYDDGNIFTNVAFDFHSTTGGLRPPYMTEAQRDAIATPGHASIVFNLDDNEYNWYDSIAVGWQVLGSGGGGGGTNNSNIGAGFRWLKPAGQEIKTAFNGYGITIDSSSNTDGLTIIADTATLFPALRATLSGGASGTVASGTQYRLGAYNATGNTISEHIALTGGRALVTDANGLPAVSTVTTTELGYVKGATSSLQTQINAEHDKTTYFSYFNEMISNIGTANDGNGLLSVVNGAAASFSQASAQDGNRPGINRANTGSTSTGRAASYTGVTSTVFGAGSWRYRTPVRLQAVSTPTETFAFIAGFYDVFTAVDQTDGIYFLYDSAGTSTGSTATNKWQCVTVSNSTRTFTTTTVDASTSWVTLEIRVNSDGSEATFYIDDVLVATHTTNIPTGSSRLTGFGHYIQKSNGSTSRYVDIDYIKVNSTFSTPRL